MRKQDGLEEKDRQESDGGQSKAGKEAGGGRRRETSDESEEEGDQTVRRSADEEKGRFWPFCVIIRQFMYTTHISEVSFDSCTSRVTYN